MCKHLSFKTSHVGIYDSKSKNQDRKLKCNRSALKVYLGNPNAVQGLL